LLKLKRQPCHSRHSLFIILYLSRSLFTVYQLTNVFGQTPTTFWPKPSFTASWITWMRWKRSLPRPPNSIQSTPPSNSYKQRMRPQRWVV